MSYKEQAMKKLELSGKKMSRAASLVAERIISRIKTFCEEEEEFAQAVAQSGKTVEECLESICKDCGMAPDDVSLYQKAAQFYFPGCKVRMWLEIDLIGDAAAPDIMVSEGGKPEESLKPIKRSLAFSFDDLERGGGDD